MPAPLIQQSGSSVGAYREAGEGGDRLSLTDRVTLGKQLGKCDRTIIRYERAGMPFIRVGALRLYNPEKVQEWLMSHERTHAVPRRGRPSKKTG